MGYWGVERVRGVLGVELRGEGGIWESRVERGVMGSSEGKGGI